MEMIHKHIAEHHVIAFKVCHEQKILIFAELRKYK